MSGRKILISVALLFVSSIFVFLTVLADYKSVGIQKIFSVFVSIGFWVSLISSYIFFLLAKKNIKKGRIKGKPGLICFFTNKYAILNDCALFVSILMIVILSILRVSNSIVYTGLISIMFFLFNMHCILNGKVFNKLIKY